jgi:hypothetical protein
MRYLIHQALFLLFSVQAFAQLPSDIIVVEGNVIELTSESAFNLASNMPMVINNEIRFECDNEGSFSVRIPYKSEILNIYLESADYQIVQPKEGEHLFETNIKPNSKYTLLIIVVNKDADEALKKDIAIAQKEVDRLKSKNKYTQRQLQDLNRRFIDSIQVYHHRIKQQEGVIERLEIANLQSDQDNKMLEDSLKAFRFQLNALKTSNSQLFAKLSKAMEERYLRQRSIFDSISKNLRLYLSRSKDVRDHLRSIEPIIKSGQLHHYYKALENYNEIYETLEGSKDEYENGINHYWNSETLTSDYVVIKNYIFEEMHKKEILALNQTVNYELQKASGGKKIKLKTVKKHAVKSLENLDKKILYLENLVDKYIETLIVF